MEIFVNEINIIKQKAARALKSETYLKSLLDNKRNTDWKILSLWIPSNKQNVGIRKSCKCEKNAETQK